MNNWDCAGSSAIGKSHLMRGDPCQDSFKIIETRGGHVAFAVSDGAGSSKLSEQSSSLTCKIMASQMADLALLIDDKGIGAWINDFIIQAILNLRQEFYSQFSTDDLRDYHCTLQTGLIYNSTAIVAHIGDGYIVAGKASINEKTCNLNFKTYVSEAQNGEYKNETYFVTEPFWLRNLRLSVFSDIDWLVAGTDGGFDLLSSGSELDQKTINSLIIDLSENTKTTSHELLQDALSSEEADKRTSDDKTLVVLFHKSLKDVEKFEFIPTQNQKKLNKENGANVTGQTAKNIESRLNALNAYNKKKVNSEKQNLLKRTVGSFVKIFRKCVSLLIKNVWYLLLLLSLALSIFLIVTGNIPNLLRSNLPWSSAVLPNLEAESQNTDLDENNKKPPEAMPVDGSSNSGADNSSVNSSEVNPIEEVKNGQEDLTGQTNETANEPAGDYRSESEMEQNLGGAVEQTDKKNDASEDKQNQEIEVMPQINGEGADSSSAPKKIDLVNDELDESAGSEQQNVSADPAIQRVDEN